MTIGISQSVTLGWRLLMAAVMALLLVLVGANLAIAQDVQGASPAPVPDNGFAAFAADALNNPTFVFILKSIFTVGLIAGLTEGLKRRFKSLQDDSDRAAFTLMTIALGIGLFLGIMGLSPPVPAFPRYPTVQTILGGFTCGFLVTAGVAYLKKIIGMREEREAAAADPRPPANGFARLPVVLALLVLSTGVALAGQFPGGVTTKLTLAATTATKTPTAPMPGRDELLLCNKDTASIWWGFGTASASTGPLTNTSAGGKELRAGRCAAIPLRFVGTGAGIPASTTQFLYTYSVAGTGSDKVEVTEFSWGAP